MNKIHKNQIIIYVIALLLVTVGYLNYTERNTIEVSSDNENTEIASNTTNKSDENIGDAVLVSNNEEESNITIISSNDSETQGNSKNDKEDTNETSSNVNNYFTNSKLEREKMYSQMLETYQKMLDNTSISEEQKSIATNEIKKINDTKNSIMICENLILTKGFENCVIFINGDVVDAIIKSKELSKEQVAQIQNILTREMNTEPENIHIMTKY